MYLTVDSSVLMDPRFDVLAAELQCSRDSALVRMLLVWLQCAERQLDRFPAKFLAPILQCKPGQVARALRRAELGELHKKRQIRICLRSVPSLHPHAGRHHADNG